MIGRLFRNHYYFLVPFLVLSSSFLIHLNHDGIGDWNDFAEFATIGRYYFLEFFQLPLWDPYGQGGVDMTLQPEINYYSPFYLLVLIFGVPAGLKLNVLMHVLLGYWGVHKWLSTHVFSKEHISLSALFFVFSSYFISHITEGHYPFISMFYLPWMLYLFRLKSLKHIFCGHYILLCLLFSSGSPNFIVFSFILYSLHLGYTLIFNRDLRKLSPLIGSSLLAVLSTMFIWAPLIIGTESIDRSSFIEINSPLTIFKSLFLPLNRQTDYGYWPAHEYHNLIPYTFWILLVLFIIQWLKTKSFKLNFYFILSLFGLWASFGGSEFYHIYGWIKEIPLLQETRVANRFSIFWVLCLPYFVASFLKTLPKEREFIIPLLTLMTWASIFPTLHYLNDHWKADKDISSLNRLGSGEYTSFSYQHDPSHINKEKFLAPNVGIVPNLRSQTEGIVRYFKKSAFILSGDAQLTSWSPNEFQLETSSSNPVIINMFCNDMWESDSGTLSCEKDHLRLIPDSRNQIKVFYNSDSYLTFIWLSLFFMVFSLLIMLKFRFEHSASQAN